MKPPELNIVAGLCCAHHRTTGLSSTKLSFFTNFADPSEKLRVESELRDGFYTQGKRSVRTYASAYLAALPIAGAVTPALDVVQLQTDQALVIANVLDLDPGSLIPSVAQGRACGLLVRD